MNDDILRRLEQLEHESRALRKRQDEIDGFHGRIRSGLARMLAKVAGKQLKHDQQIEAQDGRITTLEEWRAELTPAPARGVSSDTGELKQRRLLIYLIDKHFDDEELRGLIYDIGVDYDTLRKNGKSTTIRELIGHCERRGRMGTLISRCRELRPGVVMWPEYYDAGRWANPDELDDTIGRL